MKYLIMLVSLISFHVMASISPVYVANQPSPAPVVGNTVYKSSSYTDNQFDPSEGEDGGFITDNPIQDADIKVVQTEAGFEVTAESIFKETKKLTNPAMQPFGVFAGNNTSMMFRMENEGGQPYFVWYLSPVDEKDTAEHPKALIDRVLTFGKCSVE